MTEPKAANLFDPSNPDVAKMANVYEGRMVPVLFGPWAEDLVDRLGVRAGEAVLDVACGTGAVTRLLPSRVGEAGRVCGVDLNPAMIGIARSIVPGVELKEGDATALPVADGEFDVVLCQQGLQFVPDKAAAVSEMARALKPGGRVGIASWKGPDENPVAATMAASMEAAGWTEAAAGFAVPFSGGDPDELEALLTQAGFEDVKVTRDEKISVWPDVKAWVTEFAEVPPLAANYLSADERTRAAYVDTTVDLLERFSRGATHEIPWVASIATGTKPT